MRTWSYQNVGLYILDLTCQYWRYANDLYGIELSEDAEGHIIHKFPKHVTRERERKGASQ